MIDDLVGVNLACGEKSVLLEELAAAHSVSVSTIKRYLQRYEKSGFDGLLPKARSDAGASRVIPPEALEMAFRLRRELPSRSTPTIIRMLEQEREDWRGVIRRSTLDDHFRREKLSRRALRKEQKVRRKFGKVRRNLLWEADICIPPIWVRSEKEQKHQAVIVAAIDDCSRKIVHAECFISQETWVVETTLKKAITKHGVPAALYIDNGAQFVAKQIRDACGLLGIRFLRAKPRDAAGKGKIERWFRTMQESFVPEMHVLSTIPTLLELNRYFWAWVEEHYHLVVHSEISDTPHNKWNSDTTPLRMVDPITLEGAFLLSVERTVSNTSLITLSGQEFLVDDRLAGTRVEVRYHPRDRAQVQIWQKGQFIQIATPYEVPANSPKLRKREHSEDKPEPTGLNYLQQLDQSRQRKLRRKVKSLSKQDTEQEYTLFTEAGLLQLLEKYLHPLTQQEKEWAYAIWKQAGGLDYDTSESALKRFIAAHGRDRHLSYYLEAVLRANNPLTGKGR
jgi:transposase InsO family protein